MIYIFQYSSNTIANFTNNKHEDGNNLHSRDFNKMVYCDIHIVFQYQVIGMLLNYIAASGIQ